ncbi:hypothetical protein ACLB2K_038470 [Fragaria x ananassa]
MQEIYKGKNPRAFNFTKEWKANADIAYSYLEKAAGRMKKWADLGRKPREFKEGDMVLIKLLPKQLRFLHSKDKRLFRKYEGPFPIISKVGKFSYKVDIPAWMKVHLVFHVSNLKPHQLEPKDQAHNQLTHQEHVEIRETKPKVVEKIISGRAVNKFNKGLNVIHAIGQSGLDLSDIGGVMDAVRSLKSEFEWISWKHVRKHKNQIAHTLARRALKMDQNLLCFDSGPP